MNNRLRRSSFTVRTCVSVSPGQRLTLMPASMLEFGDVWRRVMEGLPSEQDLLVIPMDESPIRHSMQLIAAHRRRQGRIVAKLPALKLRY